MKSAYIRPIVQIIAIGLSLVLASIGFKIMNQSKYVVRHHVTRIKSEIILIVQEARKTLGKLNFKLSIISFLGGGGR